MISALLAPLRPYLWLISTVAVVVVLGLADRHGYHRATLQQQAAQAKAERAYLTRLQGRIAENATLAAHQREVRDHADHDYQQALDDIDRQRRRADQPGRLRDPGRPADCRPALSTPAGPARGAAEGAAGNDLSAAAAGFLLDLAADADRAAAYAQTCHRWVMQGRP